MSATTIALIDTARTLHPDLPKYARRARVEAACARFRKVWLSYLRGTATLDDVDAAKARLNETVETEIAPSGQSSDDLVGGVPR
jgi:hypothetical protein